MNKELIPMNKYIVKAFYDWINDNGFTVYIKFNMEYPYVKVPEGIANEDGFVILNISPKAVSEMLLDDEGISIKCMFSGQESDIFVPYYSLSHIYSPERGIGKEFEISDKDEVERFLILYKGHRSTIESNEKAPKEENIIQFNPDK